MFDRQLLGIVSVALLLLAGFVLVDSWVQQEASVAPEGERPEAPLPTPEIAAKTPGIKLDVDATLAVPLFLDSPKEDVVLPPSAEVDRDPPCPRPVDPSGWLGRRHFRSPT